MSIFLEEAKRQLYLYEKELIYCLGQGNSIHEFCLSAKLFYKKELKEADNIKFKKLEREIKHITNTIGNLL